MDSMTEEGATALAKKIRAYWGKRGALPRVWVQREVVRQSNFAGSHEIFVVRSDMRNGKPSRHYVALGREAA